MFWLILIIPLIFLFILPYVCTRMCFRVYSTGKDEPHLPPGKQYLEIKDRIFALVDKAAALPYEDVHIQSFDGLRLHGKLYRGREDAPTHILFHGYRSSALLDFGGGLCDVLDMGHSAILVDQRAHAQSEGKYLSFGINESRDCLAWIDYVNQNFGTDRKIILEGVSMGAATVLMAAGLELPENVIGVLADSGYSSPERIIRAVMRQRHFPQFLFPFLRLGGILFGGFDICSGSPVEALKGCKVPVFFIHGDEDRFVPYAMGQENFEACPGKKFFFTGKNAGHGLSYLIDREGYRKAHREFMDAIL